MTEYQRITLKESGDEYIVGSMEYPYQQAEVLYLKFIVYQEGFGLVDNADPIKFLVVQPQDILKREYEWSQEAEDELIAASNEAKKRDVMMRGMYQKAAEEEMKRKAAENAPPPEEGGDHEGLFG